MRNISRAGLAAFLLFSGFSCHRAPVLAVGEPIEIYFSGGGEISGEIFDRFFVATESSGKIEGDADEQAKLDGFFVPRMAEKAFVHTLNGILEKYDWEGLNSSNIKTQDARYWQLRIICGEREKVVTIQEYISGKDGSLDEFIKDSRFVRFRMIVGEIRMLGEIYGHREKIRLPKRARGASGI